MKSIKMLKRALFATTLSSALFMTSCSKNDATPDTTYTLSGNASGAQENPPVTTSGSGTINGTYNANTNKLDYSINWSGLSGAPTVAHFHGPALAGLNASPMVDISISVSGITGSATGSVTLHDTTEAHFLNGKAYYNIHTAARPGGEIRGQIVATRN